MGHHLGYGLQCKKVQGHAHWWQKSQVPVQHGRRASSSDRRGERHWCHGDGQSETSGPMQQGGQAAQAVLGQISRAFHYRDRHVFVRLYTQYVRPHLEFSTQAWAPWTEADKKVLERMQMKAMAMVSGLVSREYEARLAELGLGARPTCASCTRSCTALEDCTTRAGSSGQVTVPE